MSIDTTVDGFFAVLNDLTSANYHDVNHLMTLFCADDVPNKNPGVGITDYGPQFIGVAQVTELFNQLFTTFPDVALTPLPGAPRLYSPSDYLPKTIGVQTTLTGNQIFPWFPKDKFPNFFSSPLSDIHPDKYQVMKVPACAIFTFDDHSLICRLAIYLDRYRMMRQLTPATMTAAAIEQIISTTQGKRVTITIDR
jgi:hypothetical protein